MKYILKTERLFLREFINSDGFHFYHLNNDPDVIQYTGNSAFLNLEEANYFIENYSDYKKNGFGRWAVCLKESNEFLGWCGLKYESELNQVDLGFRFYKKFWGQGFATESARACIKYGFNHLKLSEIIGRAFIENEASIKVLQKCGFSFKKEFIYENQPAVLYTIKNDKS